FLIGMIAGPAVGTIATFSLRAPFFIYAGTLTVAGVLGLAALRRSELAARATTRAVPLSLAAAFRSRAYLAALAASFAGDFSLVGARAAIIPQFVTDRVGLGHGWVYAAFLIVSVVSGALLLPFGRVADTRGRRPVIAAGLLVGAGAFVLLPSAPSAVGLIVAMVLLGGAGAADSVAPGAVLGDVVAGRGGTVVAVFQMSGDLGAVLGPVLTGWVADDAGYTAALAVSAAVLAAPIAAVAVAPETLGRAAVPVESGHAETA
ncbi:MAG TPA: MFS transporter, partial [Micromonosporaceae bacterium]